MHGEPGPADVVLVAHGHILRAFVKRWLGHPLDFPLSLMLEPGAIGILRYIHLHTSTYPDSRVLVLLTFFFRYSYEHHNIKEPALLAGMAFPSES